MRLSLVQLTSRLFRLIIVFTFKITIFSILTKEIPEEEKIGHMSKLVLPYLLCTLIWTKISGGGGREGDSVSLWPRTWA